MAGCSENGEVVGETVKGDVETGFSVVKGEGDAGVDGCPARFFKKFNAWVTCGLPGFFCRQDSNTLILSWSLGKSSASHIHA